MAENESVKPLTEAQQQHLVRLNNTFLQTKQRLDEFIAYLRAEHKAPAPEWILRDIGRGFQNVCVVDLSLPTIQHEGEIDAKGG